MACSKLAIFFYLIPGTATTSHTCCLFSVWCWHLAPLEWKILLMLLFPHLQNHSKPSLRLLFHSFSATMAAALQRLAALLSCPKVTFHNVVALQRWQGRSTSPKWSKKGQCGYLLGGRPEDVDADRGTAMPCRWHLHNNVIQRPQRG